MPCENFEPLILDYLEHQLPSAKYVLVAAHLAGCAECRAFAQQLQALDAQLERTLKTPALSPDFNARLRKRIQPAAVLSPAARAARKRQLQEDYETHLAEMSLLPDLPRKLVELLGFAAMLAMAGWIAWLVIPQAAIASSTASLSAATRQLLNLAVSGIVPVGLGLLFTFPRRHRNVWMRFQPAGGGGYLRSIGW